LEQLVPYKYRRWRETEQAAAEPAPAEARPHEWRVIDRNVKLASADRGRLEKCLGCGAQRIVVQSEGGRVMVLRDSEVGEFCPVR
jgi:hypothetical protein